MSRRAKWALAIALTLVVLGVVGYGVALFVRADQTIAKHAAEVREGLERLEGRFAKRPPLADWPADRPLSERPGDARPIYERGLSVLWGADDEEAAMFEDLDAWAHEILEGVDLEAFLDDHAAQIDELQRVRWADRISFRRNLLGDAFGEREGDTQGDWMSLGSLLQLATRRAFARGDYHRAARLVELRLCLGRDYAQTGGILHHMVGGTIFLRAAQDGRHLLAAGVLDHDRLRAFAALQEQVGRNRRSPRSAWATEGLLLRGLFLRVLEDPSMDPMELSADADLRHLYATRIWLAEALERLPPWIERLSLLDALSPNEAWVRSREIRDEALATNHKLLRMALLPAPLFYGTCATVEAGAQLLRVSTALAAFRAVEGAWPARLEDLVPDYLERVDACPATGLPLGYADGKVWSQGSDGDDDGGRPVEDPRDWSSEGDIVWDLNDEAIPPLEAD